MLRRLFYTIVVVVFLVALVAGGLRGLQHLETDPLIIKHQSPQMIVERYPENESAIIRHSGGDTVTSETRKEVVGTRAVQVRICPKSPENETLVNATVEHNGRTSVDGWWISLNKSGVASFPITEGDSIRVVSDGHDADNDGTAGIEPEDYIDVILFTTKGDAPSVNNNSIVPARCTASR